MRRLSAACVALGLAVSVLLSSCGGGGAKTENVVITKSKDEQLSDPAKSLRERRAKPGRVRKAAQENLSTAVIQEYPSPGLRPRFRIPRASEERQPLICRRLCHCATAPSLFSSVR